jgi:hypothetical protein
MGLLPKPPNEAKGRTQSCRSKAGSSPRFEAALVPASEAKMIPRSKIETGLRKGLIVRRKRLREVDPGAFDRLHYENLGCARKSDHVEKQDERK